MKYWLPLFCVFIIALSGSLSLIYLVKYNEEQRQEQVEQEIQERINEARSFCRQAFPRKGESRTQCYERLMKKA